MDEDSGSHDDDGPVLDSDDLASRAPKRPRFIALGVGAAIVLVGLFAAADVYTDWLWYASIGFQTVFTTILVTKVVVALVVGISVAVLFFANLRLAVRLSPSLRIGRRILKVEGRSVTIPDPSFIAERLVIPVTVVAGLLAASVGWGQWETVQLWLKQTPFGVVDPAFGRDVGFYIFTLPMLELASSILFVVVVGCAIGSLVVYGVRGSIYRIQGAVLPGFEPAPRRHLLGIVAALFVALGLEAYVSIANLVLSTNGSFAGAGYADIHASLPILRIRIAVCLVAAALAIVATFLRRTTVLWFGAALYVATLLGNAFYPSSVQRFSVAPNELAKETPYIERNIDATRRAFGLDAVDERELSGEADLSVADVEANRATIDNIRLWDRQPLLDTFAQIQEIRTYYEFESVDNDRYVLDGRLRQVMLSARELSIESLPNRNWINERLTFTHGFGLTLGPVTEKTPEGLPVLSVRDIPPSSPTPALAINRPQIYFGELSSDYCFVHTKTDEFDYPAGDDNVFSRYDGNDGVAIGSTLRQLLFAIRLGDMKLLLSDAMTSESRILLHRAIRERLSLVAPFLRFDDDPYLVIVDGRLVWMADAYTTTDRYPYSQPVGGGINYIRNSVKATVDAYDGTVHLYVADAADPILKTYGRIFPGLLEPLDAMPAGLRAHVRYPEDIFRIQTAVYATYHMASPQVFYNKEDQWSVATAPDAQAENKERAMEPYYTIMRLPDGKDEEFILMLPFTPQRKDNLASWMVARADGENYGHLVVYRFPKQRLVYGPKQMLARINQDPEISRQLTLWDQRGSQVILGQLMVIPIKESLVYVQPLYLKAESGKIPELRRVIVAIDNRIAMEETLNESLERIFGAPPPKPTTPTPSGGASPQPPSEPPSGDLATEARQHYEQALQAQREGDWARYGEEIKRLGEILEKMAPPKK